MKVTNEKIGFLLLIIIVVANIIIACRYYNLTEMAIPDFFFDQANKNQLFDLKKRF
jgi:hypothetical protein